MCHKEAMSVTFLNERFPINDHSFHSHIASPPTTPLAQNRIPPLPAADAVTAVCDGRHDELGFSLQHQAGAETQATDRGRLGKAALWVGMSHSIFFSLVSPGRRVNNIRRCVL